MRKVQRIGIVVAMQTELDEVRNIMKNVVKKQVYDLFFFEGIIGNEKCVVVKSEVGKVNAARTTQIMIDKYNLKYVVNVGIAGGTNDKLKIGDVIITKRIVQHDFDITAFGHSKGYISNIGDLIKSNRELVTEYENALKPLKNKVDYTIKKGITATGDIFCTELGMKNKIYAKFNADAVDMECAGIAQICYLDKVPFIAIKCISDTPYGNTVRAYDENINMASKRCAEMLQEIFNK